MKILSLFLIAIVIMPFNIADAVDKFLKPNKETVITSKNLMVDQLNNSINFAGDVVVRQRDLTLKADEVIVYYNQNQKELNIYKIIANHNVIIVDGSQMAKGNTGEYVIKNEIIELKGSVMLIKNNHMITGERLIYDLKTGHSSLFSQDKDNKKSRVKAIFAPSNSRK